MRFASEAKRIRCNSDRPQPHFFSMDWKKTLVFLQNNRKAIYNLELLDRIEQDFYKSNEDQDPFESKLIPPKFEDQKILFAMLSTVNWIRKQEAKNIDWQAL